MKKTTVLLIAASLLSIIACKPGDANIPEKISTAFSKKFPAARRVTWDKENEHEWEIEFRMGKMKYSAKYDNEGNWLETEYEIAKAEIPMAIIHTLNTQFDGYKIEEAEISETAAGKVYEFALEKDEAEVEAAFSVSGMLIRTSEPAENSTNDKD